MTDPDARGWRNGLRRHDVLVFMLVTLTLTWVVWVPRAMGTPVGVVGQLWTWIPALVALGCAAVLYGRAGVRDLGRRLLLWRVSWWWYPVVLLGPLVFAMTVAGIAVLLGEPWDAARPPALTLSIPALALTLLILALTDGLGEELGWRGYLLPRLLTPPPCCPCQPDPRALLVAVAPAAGLDCGRRDRGPAAVVAAGRPAGQVVDLHLCVPGHAGQRTDRDPATRLDQLVRSVAAAPARTVT